MQMLCAFLPLGALPGAFDAAPLASGGGIGHGRARPVQHITNSRCVPISLCVYVCHEIVLCMLRWLSLVLFPFLSLFLFVCASFFPSLCASDPVTLPRGAFVALAGRLGQPAESNECMCSSSLCREYTRTRSGRCGPGRMLASATSLYRGDHVIVVVQPGVLVICLAPPASMFLALSAGRGIRVARLDGRGPDGCGS